MSQKEKERQMASQLQAAGFHHPCGPTLAEHIVGNGFVVQSMKKTDDTLTIDCKRATLYVQTYEDHQGAIMRLHWNEGVDQSEHPKRVEYLLSCTNRTPFVTINEKQYERFRP